MLFVVSIWGQPILMLCSAVISTRETSSRSLKLLRTYKIRVRTINFAPEYRVIGLYFLSFADLVTKQISQDLIFLWCLQRNLWTLITETPSRSRLSDTKSSTSSRSREKVPGLGNRFICMWSIFHLTKIGSSSDGYFAQAKRCSWLTPTLTSNSPLSCKSWSCPQQQPISPASQFLTTLWYLLSQVTERRSSTNFDMH